MHDAKGDRIGPPPHEFARPQHRFLAGTAAAVGKTDNLDLLRTGKGARPFTQGAEIGRARTEVLRLHAPDDSYFHNITSFEILLFFPSAAPRQNGTEKPKVTSTGS